MCATSDKAEGESREQEHSRRVKEHSKLIEKNISRFITNTSSPFANHIIEAGHKFEPEADTKVLHVCQKGLRLDLLEILEINKAIKSPDFTCVNDQTKFDSNTFFNSLTPKKIQ